MAQDTDCLASAAQTLGVGLLVIALATCMCAISLKFRLDSIQQQKSDGYS
jgi:multisubunit Na+/H+ antiporter MnhG subunit